jgi:hypothetical protein
VTVVTDEGTSTPAARVAESLAAGATGAALGGLLGGLIDPVLGWAGAAVGGANGLIGGWRGIYAWRRRDGWVAFGADSTWALLPVAGSMLTHVIGTVSASGQYEAPMSTRQNRHVYRGGARFKSRFALTFGNVISNAGNVDLPRRRRLITDHEDVHIWQARLFGPIYPVVYLVWGVGGALVGVVTWLRRGRREPLASLVESYAYYANPFEWWAYSRDANWPPPALAKGVGWKKPFVRPLAQVRAHRVAGDEAGTA